uniref:Uncharacterized protein n=1 Tax=Polytomella parva TaxID=51329 RepID=A0A7S0YTM1_9CHLO|mmetsp:Transcript_9169/g.17225  ORF Transcript_9169/g.17225 Transcript_9169/m.17225 type:complete len:203 (+) Transcript_9169:122-730(+)
MVHVDTNVQQAKEWNSERLLEAYEVEIFDDLSCRFERPDSRNRWDAPLFTIRPGSEHEDESFEAIVAAITRPDTVQGPAAKELKPTLATQNPSLSGTNLLFEIDSAAQEVVVAVQDAQTQCLGADSNSGVTVSFPDCNAVLALSRPFPVAELRRLKRAFLKLATKVTFARIQDRMTAKKLFIDYLRSSSTESAGDEMMEGSY